MSSCCIHRGRRLRRDKPDIDIGMKHHAHAEITTPGQINGTAVASYTANKQTDDSPSAKKRQKTKKLKRIQMVIPISKNVTVGLQDDSRLNSCRKKTVFITQVCPCHQSVAGSAQLPVFIVLEN